MKFKGIPTWVWYTWPLLLMAIFFLVTQGGGEVASNAGKRLYEQHCQSCHMPDGMGLGKLIPPLAGADYVLQGGPELACVLRYGLTDTILVNGEFYSRPMAGLPKLPAVEVRSILLYIRSAWGNSAPEISFDEVQAALNDCAPTE
ncbi:MAG: cytochrome c [Bacteroidia bacterium]|nr:cytochrome c [Bacteroidia bacterium]